MKITRRRLLHRATGAAALLGKQPRQHHRSGAAKLRAWRVSLIRARLHKLGIVDAADEKSAEAAALAHSLISIGCGALRPARPLG